MRIHSLSRTLTAFASALALLGAGGAEAAFRTYVSSIGNDGNPCTIAQPCRLLPAALAAVDPTGEIWMLDSANFNVGTVNVTKSVTILAVPGAVGSVVANSGDAMLINAAGVKVILRNLVFVNLVGSSNNGIYMTAGASLTVIDSQFSNLGNAAIYVTDLGSRGQVINSTFALNGTGVRVFAGTMTLLNNHFLQNTIAIEAAGTGRTGTSGAAADPLNGTTRVFVSGGSIIENGTAYHMDSPGNRNANYCNGSNIAVQNGPNNIMHRGNTTNISVTGPADASSCGYFDMGTFSLGQPPYFNQM